MIDLETFKYRMDRCYGYQWDQPLQSQKKISFHYEAIELTIPSHKGVQNE